LGQNPSEEAPITYYLKDRALIGDVYVEINDKGGKLVMQKMK
jgi:hypothetical protein